MIYNIVCKIPYNRMIFKPEEAHAFIKNVSGNRQHDYRNGYKGNNAEDIAPFFTVIGRCADFPQFVLHKFRLFICVLFHFFKTLFQFLFFLFQPFNGFKVLAFFNGHFWARCFFVPAAN